MPLDPQLQALQQSLNGAISGGQLVLDGTTMGSGSGPVVALFQQVFGRGAITIGGTITIAPDDANDLLLVSGTGVTALFNVTGMVVALTFGSATPTTLSVASTLTPPAQPAWTFAASFPDLAETLFAQIAFSGPLFTIATHAFASAPLKVTVVEGAGLYILPTGLTGPLQPASELATVPSPLPPFYGPVTLSAGSYTLALAMPFPAVTLDVQGFPTLQLLQPNLVLRGSMQVNAGLTSRSAAMTVEGTAGFGFVETELAIGLPDAGGWTLDLLPSGSQPIPSVTSFFALFTGIDLGAAVPSSAVALPGFWLTALSVQFDLPSGVSSFWGFSVTTAPPDRPAAPTTWTVLPGVLELRALTLMVQVATVHPGGKGPAERLITGSISGTVRIGSAVDLGITIPIPVTDTWILRSGSMVDLPSIADLARFVAGVDLNSLLPPGVAGIGAFTLTSVVLTLDPVAPALLSFRFSLTSTRDRWALVPNRLEIRNLLLSFEIEEPFGSRATTGTISGTLRIGSWDVDVVVGRELSGESWTMRASSSAMPLPSLADLDSLAGTSLVPYLPQTLATASFTLYNLLLDVDLSQAQIRQIAFELESDQAWTILTSVLVVERAGLYADVSWFTGDALVNFGIWGRLIVGTTGIEVSADRVGEGSWTFRGALAAGETISLTNLARQLLPFLPAYLPTLEVEGIAATFTTPANDFTFEGRTAGFWTFEVSSALTLKMRAGAMFQRTNGQLSGRIQGDFLVNRLALHVSYAFDPTSTTVVFQIVYDRLSLSAALTSGTDDTGRPFARLTFRLGDQSFGDLLTSLVHLAMPDRAFRLEPPWDVLNQITLKDLSLVIDLRTRAVTVHCDISVPLVFIALTGIGLKYDRSRGEGSVSIQLSGRFLDQEYSLARGNPLEWDVLHDPPPSVPARGPRLFELRYVGLGQHVSFSDLSAIHSVGDAIAALRAQMAPVHDATRNPLAGGNGSGMRFDRASGILAGADFTILSTLSVSFVFNDPSLYGMRLALAGDRAGSLAGLAFELLYKKVTSDIGVFKIELHVPDAFRQFEFGAVSITLPIIKVDVYTNGDFRVDLGFPRGGDFRDSFCVQVFPFIGYGGFYFAKLTGATSERVPRVRNGSFDPVLEFGVGLQVGLGKEIRKGPLSGGLYVTVQGILEGTVAWFTPADEAAAKGLFYRVEGIVGIVGKAYGTVDFAVIKVSVSLEARLTLRLALEAHQPTVVQVSVAVEARASVTIFFVTVQFSFSLELEEEFVIGSRSSTPWLPAVDEPAGEQPRLRMQRSLWLPASPARELRRRIRSASAGVWTPWDPILVFASKQDLPLSLLPALTVATPPNGTPALQIVFLLLAENGIAPSAGTREELRRATAAHSARTTDPMALSFNLLLEAMLQWAIYSVTGRLTGNVTAGDLEQAYALLGAPDTFTNGFSAENLEAFLAANFRVHISGLPSGVEGASPTSSTVMVMLPPLSYSFGDTTVDFSQFNPVSPDYENAVRAYYAQLVVDFEYGRAVDPTASPRTAARLVETLTGDESMATLIFREYAMIVARSAVQAAQNCLAAFTYPVTQTDSLDSIASQFPAVAAEHVVRRGEPLAAVAHAFRTTVETLQHLNRHRLRRGEPAPGSTIAVPLAITPQAIAWANRDVPVTGGTPWVLTKLTYQVAAGDSLSGIATTRFGLASAASLIAVDRNATNCLLLATGAALTIAQPASSDGSWFVYTSVAGDGLSSIAVWAFVRALPGDPQPHGAWYAQTIADLNTDPQHPYAGPDLSSVIATGTSLQVPAALDDSSRSHALTYVTRAGDALPLVAAYFDVLQNGAAALQPIETALQTLNPGVVWHNLPAGSSIKVPAQPYTVASGDSFASIAARFLIAATDLAYGANASSTALLSPLAVLALPDVTYTTAIPDQTTPADTLAGVAARFNRTVTDLATDVSGVSGIFQYPVSLTIPEVPSYPIAALVRAVVLGHSNEVAMATSRFLASGLRLPTPDAMTTLSGLYVLTGQQTPCPPVPATFTFSSAAPWIDFTQSVVVTEHDDLGALRARHPGLDALNPTLGSLALRPGLVLHTASAPSLDIAITQALLDTYQPSRTFTPRVLSGPAPLDIRQRTAVSYRLETSLHWQTPQAIPFAGADPRPGEPQVAPAPPTGEPSIWLLTDQLQARAAALGWGTTAFALFTAAGDPANRPSSSPVTRYDWATLVHLSVRQAAAAQGSGPPANTYGIAGSDADGKARLLALLDYLTTSGNTDTAQLFVLYEPDAAANNPRGLASAVINPAATFVLRTNLSTLTTSGPHVAATGVPRPALYAAPITEPTNFVQLLWEASVTASGGYLLHYADASGNGLPASLFAASSVGALRIVAILASQSADAPDRKLYAFNNCVVVGDNIDASQQTVFVAVADSVKTEWRDSASIPPGNAAFVLTRADPGTGDDGETRTSRLYSLLACHSIAAGGFLASNEGLPIAPDSPSSVTNDDDAWRYSQVLRLARLAASTLPAAAFLPDAATDPYAGIASNASVTLAFAFHDPYGNDTVSQAPIGNTGLPVGYYDDVVGVARWPGIAISYHLTGSPLAPAVTIDAALQVSSYVPGGGTSFDAARRNASAHLTRLQAVYYQVAQQAGVGLTLTTSLVQPPNAAPTPFPVDRVAFASFVSAAYLFVAAALQFGRAEQTAGTATLYSIAQQLTADPRFLAGTIAALGEANQDAATASLFAAPLALPQLSTVAFGDTLTLITARVGEPPITVLQLATNNAAVGLNVGVDIAAPTRISAPVTATTRLLDVARALHASVGALGDANATTRGLLADGAPLTVNGVTIRVEIDPVGQQTWSLADLVPKFADQGVTATPSIIAVANQALAGILTPGQTLAAADYVIQAGDTFATLQQAYAPFTISALSAAAAGSPNLFAAGTPLFIRMDTSAPPSALTLRDLATIHDLTVAQIAVANQLTALVGTAAVALPDRVTFDAPAALCPYTTPAAGVSIAAIASTFGEADAFAVTDRNWTLPFVFVPQQTIAAGTASTTTAANDSFATVYGRLHAQDPSITPPSFTTAIATSTTLIRAGALFAVVPPSTGGSQASLRDLGGAFGADPASIAQANASLTGFVNPGVQVSSGTASLTTTASDTFTHLVERFAQEFAVQTTVADLAQQNVTRPVVAAGQRFVLPPAPLSLAVALPPSPAQNPPYPGNPFPLTVDLTIARDTAFVDPQFLTAPSVVSSSTRLAPRAVPPPGETALSLDVFARDLERIYPGLKVAVGGDPSSDGRDVWIVNFGPGGITSIAIDGTAPSFFALPPLATSLQELTGVPIRTFDPATGKLVPDDNPPVFDFHAVDLEVWAAVCLAAIDQMLTPAYAAPAYRANPGAFTQLVGAKQTLADRMSARTTAVLRGSGGVAADAAERLRQELLTTLAGGYAVASILQYPVRVTSAFSSASTAPRLVADLTDAVYRTGARDDIGTVAAFYAVPQAAIALLLEDTVRILAPGMAFTFQGRPYTIHEGDTIGSLMTEVGATSVQDFVASLGTPNGFFAPFTVLNVDRVDGASGDATSNAALLTFADLVDYFHAPLPLLATSIQDTTGLFIDNAVIDMPGHGSITISAANNSLALAAAALQFDEPYQLAQAIELRPGILDPRFHVGVVRLAPEHQLSSARISLHSGSTTMNAVFAVKSKMRARNLFVRPSLNVGEIEYDVRPAAGGFDASRWLSFVRPITRTTAPLDTDLGEVLIPIPLRAYPSVPSMLEQGGHAAVDAPRDVSSAKQWRFAFSYQTHLASQDALYVDTTFNLPRSSSLEAAADVAGFRAALAQLVSAWPAVSSALTALLSWNGAPDAVLAQTVQTFAQLASDVAGGWTSGGDALADTAATTYSYQLNTTVRTSPDGLRDHLDTLVVKVLSGSGPSPTGDFPLIDWRAPDGDWHPLDLRAHTASGAVYVYVTDVPAHETIQHRLTFDRLDIVSWQNATGSTRLTRNEHLVGRAATADAFVYRTGAVGFAQPTMPLIQHDDVIVFNNGLGLQAALTALFTTLLGSASPTDYWITLSVQFGYEVVPTPPPARPLISFLPIGLLPLSQYDTTLPQRVYDIITAWQGGKPFPPGTGLFALDVTVFTSLTPAVSAKVPMLRLQHLVYDNSGASPAESAATRLWARHHRAGY